MKSYGIQLYGVRDAMEISVRDTLLKVAEMGYKYVEFAGCFGHSAEEIKSYMDEAGLVCSGTHSYVDDLRPTKIMETLAYHKKIGNPYYIIPAANLSTLERIEDFCNVMNFAKPILAAEGMRLGFHNHSTEFKLMPWGSTIHSELERRTDIDFQIDSFWAFHAGIDPVSVIERLKDRIRVIHLKDGLKNGEGTPLGMGEAPLKPVVECANAHGMTIVVESETITPSGLAEAEICLNYLKSLEA